MPIVYILTNQCMPDIVKVGITDNLDIRVKQLDNTSTPLPFECLDFGLKRGNQRWICMITR